MGSQDCEFLQWQDSGSFQKLTALSLDMGHSAPIGVFDSGIGGLSVVRHIRARLPHENLVYFADSQYNPYGDKPEPFIVERSFKITDFLLSQGAKALVVACNTATAAAIHLLRAHYKDLPIVGVEPGLKPASFKTMSSIVGVMATARTLTSHKFHVLHHLLSEQSGVHFILQPCPGLADLIERADPDSEEVVQCIRTYLLPLLEQRADTIVLGCTHYPFVQHIIERLAAEAGHPDLMVIDTGGAIARQLEHVLQDHGLLCKGTPETAPADFQIFTSGDAGKTRSIVKRLLSMDIPVRQALF